jgi:hypothetical protein
LVTVRRRKAKLLPSNSASETQNAITKACIAILIPDFTIARKIVSKNGFSLFLETNGVSLPEKFYRALYLPLRSPGDA